MEKLQREIDYNKLFVLSLIISISIGFYLGKYKPSDNFLPHDLIPVNYPLAYPIDTSIFSSYVNIDTIAGFVYLSIILSKITGLAAEDLMYLPIGSIILPLGYFMIAKHTIFNRNIAWIIPLYITVESGIIVGYYNLFKYTLTYYLLFLVITILLLQRESKEQRNLVILVIILFIGMTFIHYAIAFLTIFILFVLYIYKMIGKKNLITINLLMLSLTIFLILKLSALAVYEELSSSFDIVDTFSNAIYDSLAYFGLEEKSMDKYSTSQTYNSLIMNLKGFRSIIILIPILLYIILLIPKELFKKYIKAIDHLDPLWIAILLAGIVRAILYIRIGSSGIFNDFMIILYPFISIIILYRVGIKQKYILLYVIILISISATTLLLLMVSGDIDFSSRDYSIKNLGSIPLNINTIIDEKIKILGDHESLGKYGLITAKNGILETPLSFTTDRYESLVNLEPSADFDMAILHLDNKVVESTAFAKYKSITDYIKYIDNNYNFNKVYSDNITILLVKNR